MGDDNPKKEPSQTKQEKSDELVKSDPKLENAANLIPAELLQATRGRVDPNVILVNITQRVDPTQMVQATREMFAIIEEYDKKDVELFEARAKAIIQAKRDDPDEIDKRRNNATRRALKLSLAGFSGLTIVGGITVAMLGGPMVAIGLLLAIGAIGIAMLGPLASGESVTSSDVVRVVSALARFRNQGTEVPEQHETSSRKRKRR